jgi:hypothetical protein
MGIKEIKSVEGSGEQELGMTKREYFAAKAMQGYLAKYGTGNGYTDIAEISVHLAKALIKALEIKVR